MGLAHQRAPQNCPFHLPQLILCLSLKPLPSASTTVLSNHKHFKQGLSGPYALSQQRPLSSLHMKLSSAQPVLTAPVVALIAKSVLCVNSNPCTQRHSPCFTAGSPIRDSLELSINPENCLPCLM